MAHMLVSVANESHKPTDINGLFGIFGYGLLILSVLPLILAIIFTILAILTFVRRKRAATSLPPSTIIKPRQF